MFNVSHLIQTGGILLVAAIIFAESGMMVGFFFPGDTLLFSAGVLAATGKFSVVATLIAVSIAAILGDNAGYQIGRSLGPRLFRKPDSLIFRQEYIRRAEKFYEKYGSRTMLVAHFIPIIRAFVPATAGAGKMPRGQFIIFDAIGDIAWTWALTLLGFYAGRHIPGIENYIDPVLIAVIVIFATPTLFHLLRDPKIRAAARAKFRRSR